MRKQAFLVILLNLSVGIYAQNHSNLKPGYKGTVEQSTYIVIEDLNLRDIMFDLTTSHGYQISPYIYTGIGTGAFIAPDLYYVIGIPFFAHIKGTLIDGRVTPFADLKGGIVLTSQNPMWFIAPTIGYRFGLGKRLGINVGIGYAFYLSGICNIKNGHSNLQFDSIHSLNLKFGLDF